MFTELDGLYSLRDENIPQDGPVCVPFVEGPRPPPFHGGNRGSTPLRDTTSSRSNSGSLAQLVEQLTFNQLVAGSNPARPTILPTKN